MTPAKKPHHDDTDVEAALKRETADGSGFDNEDELPESDFDSFSEDGVENDHDGDNEVDETDESDTEEETAK
jgi:hypothetical protein